MARKQENRIRQLWPLIHPRWPQLLKMDISSNGKNLTLMIWNVRCSFLLMGCWSYFEFFDDICNFDFCLICNYSPFSYVHLLFLCIIFIYILYISKTVLIYHILYFYISRCDNKSASHWIMFDYFFHVWKLNIFYLFMFLIYSCSHVYSSIEKKINNNDTLTHICLLPFLQMAVVNKSRDFVIGKPSLKGKPD